MEEVKALDGSIVKIDETLERVRAGLDPKFQPKVVECREVQK